MRDRETEEGQRWREKESIKAYKAPEGSMKLKSAEREYERGIRYFWSSQNSITVKEKISEHTRRCARDDTVPPTEQQDQQQKNIRQ